MIRKRNTPAVGALSPGVIAVLLRGWEALRDADEAERAGVLFDLFQGREPAVAALWRAHAPFLETEAARLGIRRRRWFDDRVARYYGDHCAQTTMRP